MNNEIDNLFKIHVKNVILIPVTISLLDHGQVEQNSSQVSPSERKTFVI